MMNFYVKRQYMEKGTLGAFYDSLNAQLFWTIERPRTGDHPCIPPKTYIFERYQSPKHGLVWQARNVPDRSNIQIHIANFPHELLGCIALGFTRRVYQPGVYPEEPGVGYSSPAFDYFMALTQSASESAITFV